MRGSGSFRHRVRIERAAKVSDGRGGFTVTWATFWTGPAHIERLRSFRGDVERVTKGGIDAHPIVRIHVRRHTLLDEVLRNASEFRAVNLDDGITMNVNFAQDLTGKREEIVITATENQPS